MFNVAVAIAINVFIFNFKMWRRPKMIGDFYSPPPPPLGGEGGSYK
jgi:hypothetical protein